MNPRVEDTSSGEREASKEEQKGYGNRQRVENVDLSGVGISMFLLLLLLGQLSNPR